MVEVTITRLVFAFAMGIIVHALIMQADARYGSSRGYFLLGIIPNALAFFFSLLFLWPLLGL